MQELMEKQPNSEKFNKDIEPVVAMLISDGKAAISHVREHANEDRISKDRIGIIGFSAGGTGLLIHMILITGLILLPRFIRMSDILIILPFRQTHPLCLS